MNFGCAVEAGVLKCQAYASFTESILVLEKRTIIRNYRKESCTGINSQWLLGEKASSSAQCTSSLAVIFRTRLFSENQKKNFFKLLLKATGEKTTKDRNCLKAMKAINPFVRNWLNSERTQQTNLAWPLLYIRIYEDLCKYLTRCMLSSTTCYPTGTHSCISDVFVLCRPI